jgi:hypothetical protein
MSLDSRESALTGASAFASLRRFMQPRVVREQCELCSAALADEHPHLVELSSQRLRCACEACAILFSNQGAGDYRRVPRDAYRLVDFRLTDEEWAELNLPIELAYFLPSSRAGRVVAFYPSPGGATEALPPPEAWTALTAANPVLRELQSDVEALLVSRLAPEAEYYRVGIDQCYKLVGLIRMHWKGLSGGEAVWDEIGQFFVTLKKRAHPMSAAEGRQA